MPGCEGRSRAVRSSPADRIREGEKSFCCVTTRGVTFRVSERSLGTDFGLLPALFLGLGMLGFDAVVAWRRLAWRRAASQRLTCRRHSGSWQ